MKNIPKVSGLSDQHGDLVGPPLVSDRSPLIRSSFSITFTSNGEREFVPRDQMSPYTCRLLLIISTLKLLFHGIFRP